MFHDTALSEEDKMQSYAHVISHPCCVVIDYLCKIDKELAAVVPSREGIQKAGRTLNFALYTLCCLGPYAFFTYFFNNLKSRKEAQLQVDTKSLFFIIVYFHQPVACYYNNFIFIIILKN